MNNEVGKIFDSKEFIYEIRDINETIYNRIINKSYINKPVSNSSTVNL